MCRWFLFFAVQKEPSFNLEVFYVSSIDANTFKTWIGHDIRHDRLDLDRSLLFDVGTKDVADDIKALLHAEFFAYTWSNHLRAKGRFRSGKISPENGGNYVVTNEHAGDILNKFTRYTIDNRVRLGDEGHWQMQSLRDYALGRPWEFLADMHDAGESELDLPALGYETDHCDEVAAFRLPSINVLAGHSQPIAALKGQQVFKSLFIKDGAGVYVVFDGGDVLYVGMATRFSQRLMSASAHHKLRLVLERHPAAHVALIHYPTATFTGIMNAVTNAERESAWGKVRELIFGLERSCIGFYRPRYNGTLREANSALA